MADVDKQMDPVPVACTLGQADLSTQTSRWDVLQRTVLVERSQTADGVRISFRAQPGVTSELRALVAVESQCCAWAHWSLEEAGGLAVVTVRSTGEGIAALHGMFESG